MKKLIGKEYAPLTYQRYQTAINHLKTFCKTQYNDEYFILSEVNHKFICAFEFYLKTIINCQHNSAMKHIKALKKVMRIALANDYIRKDPFVNYKITTKEVKRDSLLRDEIEILINKEFSIKRLEVIRDLFIFQCYTGLAYKDLKKLSINHIQIVIDSNKWIIIERKKTNSDCRIPILPVAADILKKYTNHPCR